MSIIDQSATIASVTDPITSFIKSPFDQKVANKTRPADFPNGFFILEYVNGVASPQTMISLVGNMMPMQPFKWSGKQRLVKNMYPGNPEPAVQVMGPEEDNLIIHGRFKDKRLNPSKVQYGVAYQFNLAINEMRKRGNLVKFGMQGAAGDWIRWGFVERGSFEMNKQSFINYEIEFLVISEKQPINNFFAAPEKSAPSAVNQNLINAVTSYQKSYSSVPTTMPQSLSGLINNVISDVAKNINLVTNFVGSIVSTAQSIEDSASRALGLIKNARASIHKFSRQIDGLVHGFSTLSTQGNPKGQVIDTYKNIAYIYESMAGTHQLSNYLTQMQAQFEAIARSTPKARYKVQAGDTLQNISIKFFGVSDNWTDIYDHNRLQSTTLVPGTILEIPNVQARKSSGGSNFFGGGIGTGGATF